MIFFAFLRGLEYAPPVLFELPRLLDARAPPGIAQYHSIVFDALLLLFEIRDAIFPRVHRIGVPQGSGVQVLIPVSLSLFLLWQPPLDPA